MQENIAQQQDAVFYLPIYYITGNFITMLGFKPNFFLQSHFEYFCLTVFPQAFTSHSASKSRVSEVSKIAFTCFIMSEARWTAVKNVIFFSKRSIVIKLPVMINLGQTSCFQCINGLSDMESLSHWEGYRKVRFAELKILK